MLVRGIGVQPVENTGKTTGWKPIPRFTHSLEAADGLWIMHVISAVSPVTPPGLSASLRTQCRCRDVGGDFFERLVKPIQQVGRDGILVAT